MYYRDVFQTSTSSSIHPAFAGVIARAGAKDAAPRRLAYYASPLPDKETWFQTDEGYRIYKNVPVARTGSQTYIGREIKKNPGYREEWGIGDDELVTVYRLLEDVTAPEAVASGEGKSVLDEHPPDPQVLVDAIDEYDGRTMGHGQNLRVGPIMPDGETYILADLHVKHPDLNMKIESGIREVSCGYTFMLDKDAAGRYIMRKIVLNHFAIVPKGRAGSFAGIGDASPVSKSKGTSPMSISNRFLVALGLQAAIKDAKPEEADTILAAVLADHDRGVKDAAAEEKAAKDAADAKAAKDKDKEDDEEGAKDEEIKHASDCPCKQCKAAKDADKDEFGEDSMTDADMDDEGTKDEDGNALILSPDERSRSTFSVGDSLALLDALKPAVARSKDKAVKDAYVKLRKGTRAISRGVKDGAPDPFKALTRINADGGVDDSEPEVPQFMFFNNTRPYGENLKDYNEYLALRAGK